MDDIAVRPREPTTGRLITTMIAIGYRPGLFEALAAGPATPAEPARRFGCTGREWLGSLVVGELVVHDDGRHLLPAATRRS